MRDNESASKIFELTCGYHNELFSDRTFYGSQLLNLLSKALFNHCVEQWTPSRSSNSLMVIHMRAPAGRTFRGMAWLSSLAKQLSIVRGAVGLFPKVLIRL